MLNVWSVFCGYFVFVSMLFNCLIDLFVYYKVYLHDLDFWLIAYVVAACTFCRFRFVLNLLFRFVFALFMFTCLMSFWLLPLAGVGLIFGRVCWVLFGMPVV